MSETSGRQTVMASVRRAVAGWREAAAPPAPIEPAERAIGGAVPSDAGPVTPLIERFVTRAEAAEAFVAVASDFVGALQRVADILCEIDAHEVLVSEDAWQQPWRMAKLADVIEDCSVRPTSALRDASASAVAKAAYVGITGAAYGIAETGTLVVPASGRIESLLPPVHIALLPASRLLPGLPEALRAVEHEVGRSSAVTFITGPSRTADIELTLTIGVHGPKQLFIILVKD